MNDFRTAILLASLTALFAGVGFILGGHGGMLIAFLVALAMNLFNYWNSDKIVLRLSKAREVDARSAPDFFGIVRQLALSAQLPMPRVFLMDSPQPNAFATGRSPEHATICATTGLLNLLSKDEVQGVLAHELAHVKNRDTLLMTMTATFAGAIGLLANYAQISAIFGGGNRGARGGWLGTLVVALLAPIGAGIVQMAISRTREYDADRAGALITGQPLWLASALKKISDAVAKNPNETAQRHRALAHMYIVNPLSGLPQDSLFSTHPRIENRIAELERLAAELGQAGGAAAAGASLRPRGGGSGGSKGPWG